MAAALARHTCISFSIIACEESQTFLVIPLTNLSGIHSYVVLSLLLLEASILPNISQVAETSYINFFKNQGLIPYYSDNE